MWSVAGILGIILAAGVERGGELGVREETATMVSGAKEISLQVFLPDGVEKAPAALLLHGADGLKFENWAQTYRRQARAYARHGFVVVLPHYMDRTDNGPINGIEILRRYPEWLETVQDTVGYAVKHPRVAPERLAVMGLSLGGTLAIDLAARDRRVKVLIDYFGGFPAPIAGRIRRLPPTLILHGARDRIVSPKDAERLDHHLNALNVEHELKLYPTAGHGFFGADERDAAERGVGFLKKYLAAGG